MSKTGISSGAFSDKSTITSVSFGNKCTYVGKDAFKNCISFNKINNDNVIEEIEDRAFAGTNLSSVNFSNLNSIGNGAFENCSNLEYINIQNCKEIPNNTFRNCINLKDINFKNFYSIGSYAFSECKSIENLNLDNCKTIGEYAFYNCENLNQITLSSGNLVLDSGISDFAFLNCKKLSKVYINIPLNDDTLNKCIPLGNDVFYVDSEINSNIRFYLPSDIISQYKEDSSWGEYSNYMFAFANEKQIVYTTNDNIAIDIDNDEITNKYIDKIYGLIEFQYTVNKLNQHFFKEKNTLTSVILPSNCEEVGDYEFEDCENLNSFVPSYLNTLTKIGDYAFKNCKSFTSFTIPESITELGEGIFAGCSNIEKFEGNFVTYNGKAIVYKNTLICILPKDDNITEGRIYKISDIDSSIQKLGKSCFYGCKELRRVDIPSNILKIGDSAFEGCNNLREVHFDRIVPPNIGNGVFGDVTDREFKIFVPEDSFEDYCDKFKNSGYESYIYPKPTNNCIIYYGDKIDGIESEHKTSSYTNGNYYIISNVNDTLQKKYFSEQESVTKVIIGEKIKDISKEAFKNCKNLEYIYLPSTIKKLDNQCFYCCEKLKSIHIPNEYDQSTNKGKTTFGNEIFYGCTDLKDFNSYYSRFISSDGRCYIDDSSLIFFACGDLQEESYIIPDNVIEINKYAFSGTNIKNITLNEYIKNIGEYAFADCTYLNSINNWDNVETISKFAFKCAFNHDDEIGISLPNNLKTIGESAFEGCEKMYISDIEGNTYIPSTVTTIGNNAFKDCGLKGELTFGNIKCINVSAFQNCKNLTQVNINENIETIENNAFCDCTGLKKVLMTNTPNLKYIKSKAFYNCNELKEFDIPDGVVSIGDSAFEDCFKYEGVINSINSILTIPKSVSTIGSYCFKNSGIKILEISNKNDVLKIIPKGAFCDCSELYKITLSNSITSIGDSAFENCNNIVKIDLPSNLYNLGHYCFKQQEPTSKETKIYIPESLSIPPAFKKDGINSLKSYPFGESYNRISIHVPNSIIIEYRINSYWSTYKSKMVEEEYYITEQDKNNR